MTLEKEISINVGSIILAPGHRDFDPTGLSAWGYKRFANVITSSELERYLAVAGPTGGNLIRPSDGGPVGKMAFLQCVGSRDNNQISKNYCSSVCCMSAIKEASDSNGPRPNLDVSIFHMDIRTQGKDFRAFLRPGKAERDQLPQMPGSLRFEPGDSKDNICLRYITENGKQTTEQFDLVVLSVGIETTPKWPNWPNVPESS